jgi:hypothetical protein
MKPLKTEPNVAVSIRNPADCIASWINLCNDKRPDRVKKTIDWYCDYYLECKTLNVPIIWFDQLINDPETCIRFVDQAHDLKTTIKPRWDLATNFHYPTVDKTKIEVLKTEVQNSPDFIKAQTIYESLAVACPKAANV